MRSRRMTCRHDGNRRSFRSVETQLTGMVRTCPVLLAVVVALAASGSVDAGIAQTPVTPATSRFVVAFVFVEAMKSLSSSPSKLRTLSNAVTSAALHRVILRSLPKSALMIGGALTVHHLTKVARQFRVGIDGMVQRDRTQSKLEVTKRALKLALLRPARIAGAAFGALPLVTRKWMKYSTCLANPFWIYPSKISRGIGPRTMSIYSAKLMPLNGSARHLMYHLPGNLLAE
ncbi:unnamed protein product (mitochondrion) [Plasmodiophora brassicae]|uniref:Uncharacterized protein n=1 Tax=Plasmodiophora brassicae TaxID=37360 RepID=A0A3P3Y569_PLABS|nr:unnamed protein product [Plasmodiophora brassicae]